MFIDFLNSTAMNINITLVIIQYVVYVRISMCLAMFLRKYVKIKYSFPIIKV